MDRDDILQRLRDAEPMLRACGVTHAALFGSRARGDARADSDTDILIDIDRAAPVGLVEYLGLKELIAGLIGGRADVVERDGLHPMVRPSADQDAVYAF